MRPGAGFALFGLCIAVAGCEFVSAPERPSAPPASGPNAASPVSSAFAHSQSGDISGEYRLVAPADGSQMRLYLGQTADFEAWEAGRRSTGFAPVMLELDGERVLPDSYSVSDGQVRMAGRSSRSGAVSFSGRLDKGALAMARRNLGEAEAPAMTGSITVGGATRSGLKLNWYGGD